MRMAWTLSRQTFQLTQQDAKSVLLAGDFTAWQEGAIKMEKGNNGIWATTVKLPPGKHNYLFIVDGEWREDPECLMRVPNPYGGCNMVRQVADAPTEDCELENVEELAEQLQKLKPIIEEDYRQLCLRVGVVKGVPLDLYVVSPKSTEKSDHGIARSYPFPGYNQKAIHLALDEVELLDFHLTQPVFPPTKWHLFYDQWPSWRVNLWHETIHQYDDQTLHTWDPKNAHGKSWANATRDFASRFKVAVKEIEDVTHGAIAPLSVGSTGGAKP